MNMKIITRIQDYRQNHGTAYTFRRLGQKAAQQLLGTYDFRRRKEAAADSELEEQRKNQPDAGLISVVIPVYNTDPGMLSALLDSHVAGDQIHLTVYRCYDKKGDLIADARYIEMDMTLDMR